MPELLHGSEFKLIQIKRNSYSTETGYTENLYLVEIFYIPTDLSPDDAQYKNTYIKQTLFAT